MKKIKVAFLCSQFGGGGAEKHLLRVINAADFSSYEITLILTRDGGNYEKFLDTRVNVLHLSKNVNSSLLALVLAYTKLKRIVYKIAPDVVVSFMDRQNVLAVRTLSGRGTPPVVLCCQNMPSINLENDGFQGKWHRRQMARRYKDAEAIIAICKGVRDDVARITSLLPSTIPVIYNAGYDAEIKTLSREEITDTPIAPGKLRLLACGRLTRQKGFDVLLPAFAEVVKHHRKVCLEILGMGPDEADLRQQVEELGIAEQVRFLGFQANPYPYFRRADLFVLSSRWEGFGNVITEAMACGTPVLSTRCPSGPDEIIEHGQSGWLVGVENAKELAEGMRHLIDNSELRATLGSQGEVRSESFAATKISKQYFDFIAALLKRKA